MDAYAAMRAATERPPELAHEHSDDDQPLRAETGDAHARAHTASKSTVKAEAASDKRRSNEDAGFKRQVSTADAGLKRQLSTVDVGFKLTYKVLTETEAHDLVDAITSGMQCSSRNMAARSALATA
jgi:hypothetical protein